VSPFHKTPRLFENSEAELIADIPFLGPHRGENAAHPGGSWNRDTTVSVDDSRQLVRNVQEIGATYWYMEISGAPHSFHLEPAQMDLKPLVLSFLAKHLGNPIPSA